MLDYHRRAHLLAHALAGREHADQAHYCRGFHDAVGPSPNAWQRRTREGQTTGPKDARPAPDGPIFQHNRNIHGRERGLYVHQTVQRMLFVQRDRKLRLQAGTE